MADKISCPVDCESRSSDCISSDDHHFASCQKRNPDGSPLAHPRLGFVACTCEIVRSYMADGTVAPEKAGPTGPVAPVRAGEPRRIDPLERLATTTLVGKLRHAAEDRPFVDAPCPDPYPGPQCLCPTERHAEEAKVGCCVGRPVCAPGCTGPVGNGQSRGISAVGCVQSKGWDSDWCATHNRDMIVCRRNNLEVPADGR
jgi:hypothetical protein